MPPSTNSERMTKKSKAKTSDRKAVISSAYDMAIKNDWHVNEAAAWATKQYGMKIAKGDIQYHAMKNGLPYLDELKLGIRMKIL